MLIAVTWGFLGLLGSGRSTDLVQPTAKRDGESWPLPFGVLASGPAVWTRRRDGDDDDDSLSGSDADPDGDILPRPKRKPRKAREDQGLPEDDAELEILARAYLKFAHDAWPELVKSGLLPIASDAVISQMVAQFKERHRSGRIDAIELTRWVKAGLMIAACYPRYSDPNSQSKSIPDQLRIAIACAKSRGLVIPWGLLVADYARRATWGRRQGFENLLKLIGNKEIKLSAVIIDDFDRGSRNDPESWKLAGKCKMLKIGLYGASDGFHIDDPNWDQQVRLRNMFNRMEYTSKRQRVLRGQSGMASENRPIGRLPLGYGRKPLRDRNGNVLMKPDGGCKTQRCFDPETKAGAELMWELFYVKKWSTYRIAVEFNRLRIDGGESWSDNSITQMLLNPAYIGLFIWGRTTKEFNWKTQRYEIVNRPWQNWVWYYDPELAIVPKAWHVYARNKLVKSRVDKSDPKKRKHPERLPATLLSGTLECGYCGRVLTLCRSTDKYKSLCCLDGLYGKHGCQLKVSKSTAIIERRLLRLIHDSVLTTDNLAKLIAAGNAYLAQLARLPRQDEKPLRARAKKLNHQIDRLVTRVKISQDDKIVEVYEQEISKLKAELRQVAADLAAMSRSNTPPPPPLDPKRVETYLTDLRAVLSRETPAAAAAIRSLTGPIQVTQAPHAHTKHGARWILKFTPSALPLLRELAVRHDYPDSRTLELLCAGNWIVRAGRFGARIARLAAAQPPAGRHSRCGFSAPARPTGLERPRDRPPRRVRRDGRTQSAEAPGGGEPLSGFRCTATKRDCLLNL